MKTIGILFDVSGSMKAKFNNIKDIDNKSTEIRNINNNDEDNEKKKSDELIDMLEKIAKNSYANIFTILFGLREPPYITDFIKLLQISNEKFKIITTKEDNATANIYREKLIDLLSYDKDGNQRFCDIREYVLSPEGPSEKLSEFFCNLMEQNREITDDIYNKLPKEVTDENENRNLNERINNRRTWVNYGGGGVGTATGYFIGGLITSAVCFVNPGLGTILAPYIMGIGSVGGGGLGCRQGNNYVDNRVNDAKKKETITAIKKSFKRSIEITTKKIIDEYKLSNFENYELIKGENLSKLINDLKDKIIQPKKDEKISIIELFETIIYGNTPLFSSCKKAFEIFEKNTSKNKILFIISDGLLNDEKDLISAQRQIKEKLEELEIITICIYLNASNELNNKTFYNKIQYNSNEGAKFLFNISSQLDYHNSIINFFIKQNWNIPLNGVCNLFVEINNSKDLNQFIDLVNKALDYNDPIDFINKIIGNSLLDKIIDENYIKQFNSVSQEGARCWAWALSEVIYLASTRVFGRKIKKFDEILEQIKNDEKTYNDKLKENQGRPVFKMAEKYLKIYKLRGKVVSPKEAKKAVLKGRPCLCRFYLDGPKWDKFSEFFRENPKGILTKKIINQKPKLYESGEGGHAVVLTSIEKNCLKFLNSWGAGWGDKGYFRIENEEVFSDMKPNMSAYIQFMDIFWYESDLTKEEIDKYNNNYLSFIKQASNYISDSKLNIREELNKNFECLICKEKSSLKFFELLLRQKHDNNDGKELRKLKIKCLKCNQEFENDSLTTLLYLNTIME